MKEANVDTRQMFRRLVISVLFASLLSAQQETLFAQLIPVNFVYSGSGGITDPLKFAHEKGFFKKHNLDLAMIYVSSGVTAAQTLVSGSAVAANVTVADVLRPMIEGAPMKVVTVNVDRFQHLFVARPGINGPKDMKGKKVAVSRYGAFSDIQTRFLLRQWGMDPDKDVYILQIGNSAARAAALASGGVDGGIVTPSFIPAARKSGLNVIYDLSTIPTKFANVGLVIDDRVIKQRPHVAKAIVAGYVDGVRNWKSDSLSAKAFLKKTYNLPDTDIDHIYAEHNKAVRSEPTPDLEGLQNLWDSVPDLKARGKIDLTKFVDARFIDEVLKGAR